MIPRADRGMLTWLRGGLVSLVLLSCFATPSQSQLLEDLRSNHRSASARLEGELRAFEVLDRNWQVAYDSVEAAKSRNDDAARDGAYVIAYARGVTRDQSFQRQEQMRADLKVARDNLRAALITEIAGMESAYETATAAIQENIDAVIAGMEQEIRALDQESERPRVTPLGQISIVAIDRPDDILAKADLIENRANQADQSILDIDIQLDDLNRRLRRQRTRRDVRSARERFDDVRVPVGATAQSGTDGANNSLSAADSLGIRAPQTLEEEIQLLESIRASLVVLRDELRGRARAWRTLAEGRL